MRGIILLFLYIISGINLYVFADSPLTSTDFYSAYFHDDMVRLASEEHRLLDKQLCLYLNGDHINIANRLAVISALSGKGDNRNNYEIYLKYLIASQKNINIKNFKKKSNEEQLICLAYLKAIDNPWDVKDALELANLAIRKNRKSFSIHVIHAIIKAHHQFMTSRSIMGSEWCKVYEYGNTPRDNKKLIIDMNEKAIHLIYKYIDLYKDSC